MMTANIIIDPNYPKKFGKEGMEVLSPWALPAQVKRMYGCPNCEWRGTPMCSFGLKRGNTKKKSHTNGICIERINYLKSFYTGTKIKPTYLEWRECYTRAIAHMRLDKETFKIDQLEQEIEKLEQKKGKTEESMELLIQLREKYYQYKNSWLILMKHISALENEVIKRDIPKKIEIDSKISLTQIHQIVDKAGKNKEVQDGEYREMEE